MGVSRRAYDSAAAQPLRTSAQKRANRSLMAASAALHVSYLNTDDRRSALQVGSRWPLLRHEAALAVLTPCQYATRQWPHALGGLWAASLQ